MNLETTQLNRVNVELKEFTWGELRCVLVRACVRTCVRAGVHRVTNLWKAGMEMAIIGSVTEC